MVPVLWIFTPASRFCLQMDSSGDLVAAGYRADEESNGDVNFLVVKLSGIDGSTLWTFSPNTTSGDVFHGVDLDDRGNVFVAGGEGAPNIEGKFATTPVISKINGFTGQEMWSYRGGDGDRIIFKSVTVDQNTGWVVGAGATRQVEFPGGVLRERRNTNWAKQLVM